MISIAADYARAVAYLDRRRLPAYVSFVEQASAHGVGGSREAPRRIYVRMSDGAIVSGVPSANVHVIDTTNGDSDNPFRDHGVFEPDCYVPKTEEPTRWGARQALRFDLQAVCAKATGINELYVDPNTLRPIAAVGTVKDNSGDSNMTTAMTTALEVRYRTVDQYTVPSSIRAHAVGHGWLFWARERAEVDYTNYRFYQTAEIMRRQASIP